MAFLYLITHAHTQVEPALDAVHWRLSSAGQAQAEALAALPFWPDIDRIVVSREAKTRLTIAPVLAKQNIQLVEDGHFDEAVRPGWVEEYSAHVQDFFAASDRSVGGWEPATHALQRFLAGIALYVTPHDAEQLALVSHGLVLSLYRAHLLGQWPADFDAWRQLGFAAVACVDLRTLALIEDFKPVTNSPLRG
ncbi:histidine phosphatase family protein [Caldilinea sp.]|uniref:histidine phosphatase family protein n=1 Tax=Caldilinea sp. TaxID=2293560 RepID=UPI002D059920|nr:histidine phosphatase family protein [Anaerolineales bacterium]HQY90637.1 histidine phosphatase family protein [Caldilinea sp.]